MIVNPCSIGTLGAGAGGRLAIKAPCCARSARLNAWHSAFARRNAHRASTEHEPCFHRARRLRASPSGVRGPVLLSPCSRHRRFLRIAGPRHGCPLRLPRALHRLAIEKSPSGLPFFSQPRRSSWGSLPIFTTLARVTVNQSTCLGRRSDRLDQPPDLYRGYSIGDRPEQGEASPLAVDRVLPRGERHVAAGATDARRNSPSRSRSR